MHSTHKSVLRQYRMSIFDESRISFVRLRAMFVVMSQLVPEDCPSQQLTVPTFSAIINDEGALIAAAGINLSPVLEQQSHNVDMSESRCGAERTAPVTTMCVDMRSVVEQ
nr:hypothetical protein CFP56_76944 [Quercus suber]